MPKRLLPSEPSPASRSPLRVVAEASVLVLVVTMLLDAWVLGGLLVPAVVQGGSMTPAMLGAHLQWKCTDCCGMFACDLESLPPASRDAVCPHCGQPAPLDAGKAATGQRVWVNRAAYWFRAPRRWEAVVLRSPDDPEQICIKRVVGLPGEHVELRDGDVLINGTLAVKDDPAQSALAVVVAGAHIAARRWQPEQTGTWHADNGVLVHATSDSKDWLVYQHAEPTAACDNGTPAVLDGNPCDQNESRRLNPVPDFLLRFEVCGRGEARYAIRAGWQGEDFYLSLPIDAGAVRLSRNGSRIREGHLPTPARERRAIQLAVCDGRLTLSSEGATVLEFPLAAAPAAGDQGRPRLAIGTDAQLALHDLTVLRDVYYTCPVGNGSRYQLGPDEYFVLGDNSPHSVDSRTWSARSGVSSSMLLGPALVW